jgi:large subunit ribosomal protein L40
MFYNIRKRKVAAKTDDEKNDIVILEKEWSKYKTQQHKNELEQMKNFLSSQDKALKQLKKDSLELYNEAIKVYSF